VGRAASLALLAAFVVGNGLHTARFLAFGRGGYRAALAFMAEHSDGGVISVGSNHDFRTGLVLRYYARRLPPGWRLALERRDAPNPALPNGPEWRIVQRAETPDALPPIVEDGRERRYALAASFPHAGISGFHWSLYRRAPSSGERSLRRSSTIPNP
jgi:hypothetical protein